MRYKVELPDDFGEDNRKYNNAFEVFDHLALSDIDSENVIHYLLQSLDANYIISRREERINDILDEDE